MKNSMPAFFPKLLVFGFIFNSFLSSSQTSMFAEFKAIPAFPLGAKEAFKACKTSSVDSYYSFQDYSEPTILYLRKIQNDTKPFEAIVLAKGKAGIAPGMGAANDFSDLNSPETQAKIAKMTEEEKIKFAMEIQERMKNNKNVQYINTASKPSPLTAIVLKLSVSSQKLLSFLPEFTPAPFKGYGNCGDLCPVIDDPTCAARMRICENKAAHAFTHRK